MTEQLPWPPKDGQQFIRSSEFGDEVVTLARQLMIQYPSLDFTDAVARVFAWFDTKLKKNRRFINGRRFRNRSSFHAYLRQALWNAARMSARERAHYGYINELPADEPIASNWGADPQDRLSMLDLVKELPPLHKAVFDRFFFEEERISDIALSLHKSETEIKQLYEEAVDLLSRLLEGRFIAQQGQQGSPSI